MAFDFIAWHGRDINNHKAEFAKASAAKYRTSSLCMYGEPSNPLFAAVMVKRSVVHAEQQVVGQTKTQFSETIDAMWKQKFGAYVVSATGTVKNPLFSASFRPMGEQPILRFGILGTGNQMMELNHQFWRDGYMPIWLDAYGTPDDTQLVAIWRRNTDRIPWNLEVASQLTDVSTLQALFNANVAQGGRPLLMAAAPGNRYLGLYVDNQVGGWVAQAEMTGEDYQQEFNKHVGAGLCPISVSAQGTGNNARFAAIFADREKPFARLTTSTTTIQGAPAVPAIDNAMLWFMNQHSIRGCSLAIIKNTRLVYARGYTSAESGYPIHTETTLFRQASVSKTFAAAALYRLIQLGAKTPDGTPVTLDTTMQSVLGLTIPPKSTNKMDARFENITIRHLLESISSINQWLLWSDIQAAGEFGAPLPCKPAQLASFIAAQPLGEKNPGDTTNVSYGNTDYFLLSQVIAALAGTNTFEEALTKLVLTPLKMTRVRGSRSLLASQAPDEARYHNTNIDPVPAPTPEDPNAYQDWWLSLWCAPSSMSSDQPMVPHQYGNLNYELFDGCGGVSAAVTDIARLLAALNVRSKTGVFSETTLASWFNNTVNASQTNTNTLPEMARYIHGYHGFDSGKRFDTAQPAITPGNFTAGKGGWLPSHASGFEFVSGGYSYVIACNGVGQSDISIDWLRNLDGKGNWWEVDPKSVMGVTEAHDWGTTDLFPAYGMPSFPSGKQPIAIGPIDFSKLPKDVLVLQGANALERTTMTAALKRAAVTRLPRKRP